MTAESTAGKGDKQSISYDPQTGELVFTSNGLLQMTRTTVMPDGKQTVMRFPQPEDAKALVQVPRPEAIKTVVLNFTNACAGSVITGMSITQIQNIALSFRPQPQPPQ